MRNLSDEKKKHPNEYYFCRKCGAANYGYAYWCIKCGAFAPTQNFSSVKGHKMKTYIVTSITNYDLMVHIVNAESKEKATALALKRGAWEGCETFEIDTKTEGLVFKA